jgi:uncharacterized protein
MAVDFGQLARELSLGVEQIQRTVELLDEDNTVPFITRYRKDQTGGLDEEQIRRIQEVVARQRMLAERKVTILKSIESQGKLTPELAEKINRTTSTKRLEDLYLPYKPKKQTLATLARERGLEPLADEVLSGDPAAIDLPARGQFFVNPDRQLHVLADVLQGVGHLLAERFSERADLRGRLRKILWRTGKLVTTAAARPEAGEKPEKAEKAEKSKAPAEMEKSASAAAVTESLSISEAATRAAKSESSQDAPPQHDTPAATSDEPAAAPSEEAKADTESQTAATASDGTPATDRETGSAEQQPESAPDTAAEVVGPSTVAPSPAASGETTDKLSGDSAPQASSDAPATAEPVSEEATSSDLAKSDAPPQAEASPADASSAESSPVEPSAGTPAANEASGSEATAEKTSAGQQTSADAPAATEATSSDAASPAADTSASPAPQTMPAVAQKKEKKKKKKKSKKDKAESAFQDYYDFQESVTSLPPHRILAINRGERAKALRVRIEADNEAIEKTADELLVPPEHPHADFLRSCVRDALSRLVLPSLEREIRRELTERAEQHAVEVFARNLRNLLLQPPVRGKRVLAIDPGYRSGCKLTALDEFGNVLASGVLHIVGKAERRARGRKTLIDLVNKHHLSVIALGNGTGCRETEKLVASLLSEELAGRDMAYIIVNEAGASVYSTSDLGREELPHCDAVQRSAVSIGRRLLDPLSELVKINPANIGVGMYQHDVKAGHLRNSLDAVVESCVNYVGVDVNTASPALLRYVSGLNQLTARRLYEYRREHGPFRSRQQFRDVPGFGAAAFVQAAGFLKINGGEHPLDATWIHPESYEVAERVLEKLDCSLQQLAEAAPQPAESNTSEAAAVEPAAPEAPPAEETAAAQVESTPSPAEPSQSEPIQAQEEAAQTTAVAEDATADDAGSTNDKPHADGEHPPVQPVTEAAPAAEAEAAAPPSVEAATPPEPSAAPEPPSPETQPAAGQTSASAAPASSPTNGTPARNPLWAQLANRAGEADADKLAEQLHVGRMLLKDILTSLARPGRDPRDDLPPPLLRRGATRLEDLQPGMELAASVLNVVDFGAFVDIGLPDSGLIHISRLADRYVRDPHEVVAVGDILRVWVVEVSKERRRVSLTAIEPGKEKPKRPREKPAGRPPRERGGKPRRRSEGKGKTPQGKQQRGGKRGGPPKPYQTQTKRKPKPVKPITKAMQEGREPMRSFSDLQQFFQKKKTDDDENKSQS